MTHRYFPGLNALRFFAALSVVFAHLAVSFNQLRPEMVRAYAPALPFDALFLSGWDAVNLFLVLSGFLITYLLLNERRTTGKTNLVAFWKRRALRIWPLYYALAIPAAIILPALPSFSGSAHLTPLDAGALLLIQPHWISGADMGPFIHLWSLGVEEMFYLLFPLLIGRSRRVLNVAFAIVILRFALQTLAGYTDFRVVEDLLFRLRFECILVGCLGAYLYVYQSPLLQLLYRRSVQWTALFLLAIIIVFGKEGESVTYNLASSLVFMILILNIATNPGTVIKLRNPAMEALGALSYAIYMWHLPVLFVVVILLGWVTDPSLYTLMLYGLTVGLTFVAAYLSHRFLELPFLRLKDRVARPRQRLTVAAAD